MNTRDMCHARHFSSLTRMRVVRSLLADVLAWYEGIGIGRVSYYNARYS